MASSSRVSGLAIAALLGSGAAALVLACVPATWPNPLPDGPLDVPALLPLCDAARAVDAACERGDRAAFAAATTDQHRARLSRQLSVVDRDLDAATLQALGGAQKQADWLGQPLLSGLVRGRRSAIAVQRPGNDGAQVLSFVWDGKHLLLDESVHVASVRSRSAADVAVADAVAARR